MSSLPTWTWWNFVTISFTLLSWNTCIWCLRKLKIILQTNLKGLSNIKSLNKQTFSSSSSSVSHSEPSKSRVGSVFSFRLRSVLSCTKQRFCILLLLINKWMSNSKTHFELKWDIHLQIFLAHFSQEKLYDLHVALQCSNFMKKNIASLLVSNFLKKITVELLHLPSLEGQDLQTEFSSMCWH